MKAILEFNLPEEREEFEHAQKGVQYKGQLDEIAAFLRELRKYRDLTIEKQELLKEIEEKFYEITEDQ